MYSLLVFLILSLSILTPASADFTVTKGGEPRTAIRVPGGTGSKYSTLAKELQSHIQEATGAELPIASTQFRKSGIVLGTADDFPQEAAAQKLSELGPEGFIVKSDDSRCLILANTEMGLTHAVYAFLEEIGYRWYFADPVWTVTPKRPTLTVSMSMREKPAFDYRIAWYGWGPRTPKLQKDWDDWNRHNRQLGAFSFVVGHSYDDYIPKSEFSKHPEWFALVDGKRQDTQLCTSNPEVQRVVTEAVIEKFRKNPGINMLPIEPNDGGESVFCKCDNCVALGSMSDRIFGFANVVARGVRKEFPDKWLGMLAYADHSDPPSFKMEPNVFLMITTGFRWLKSGMSFEEQAKAFQSKGGKIGVYDYFEYPLDWSMGLNWELPTYTKAGRVYELARLIRQYRDIGFTTYDAEASCSWGPSGLGYWVFAKTSWNPDLDARKLTSDFYRNAFGAAAKPMSRIYERWSAGEKYDAAHLSKMYVDLAEAYRLNSDNSVGARLDRIAMYFHFLMLGMEFDALGSQKGSNDKLIAVGQELAVYTRRISETGLTQFYPQLYEPYWMEWRFKPLYSLPNFDAVKAIEKWREERTDLPTPDEIADNLRKDLDRVEALRKLTGSGAKAYDLKPGAVQ